MQSSAEPSTAPRPVPVPAPAPAPAPAPRPPRESRLRRYAREQLRWRAGNRVRLLRAGLETFPAMLEAIAAARRTVHLETYIFVDDKNGGRFVDALDAAARRGVTVRLIYDALGALELDDAAVARMRGAGVQIVVYRPIAPWRRRWGFWGRDHRKILVVDDEVAFTGGLNLGDDYADVTQGGRGWHDMHCRLEGPIVLDLARSFRRVWLGHDGAPYPSSPKPADDDSSAPVLVRLLDNTERRRRTVIRRAYLAAIRAAQTCVYLENAYFLPDRGVRGALMRAARRGVDVAVIVPGRSDIKAIELAGHWIYPRLVKRGVRILRWRGPMMHAKTAVVDGTWSTIGSYNLDAVSLRYNLEVAVEVIDPEHGSVMLEQFRRDVVHCDPVSADEWKQLSWWRKVLAMLAFRVRRWL